MTAAATHATHVATLVCDPAAPALDSVALEGALAALSGSGAPHWLDPGVAADLLFLPSEEAIDVRTIVDRPRAALAGHPVDVVVQQRARRRKMLLVADMDSTMIGQECLDELEPADTLAVGDGADDLPMLDAAGLGVACRANPKVASAVQARIEHGDLTALLYAQGYPRAAFVTPGWTTA